MIYGIYDIYSYIHISYGIADTGIRDIIYIYDTDICGIQYRTILYQF